MTNCTNNKIETYTDGSCIKKKIPGNLIGQYKKTVAMGYGIVIKIEEQDKKEELTFKGITQGPLSSTRAELMAIAVLLDISPRNKTIKIYTDSSAAIAAINGYIDLRKRKKRKSYKNPYILQTIEELIVKKEIKIELVKIKAHTGIKLNEKADQITDSETSQEDQKYRTFKLKLLIEGLPTKKLMHERYPQMYQNSKYIKCNNHEETSIHALTCSNRIKELQGEFFTIVRKEIQKVHNRSKSHELIEKEFKNHNIIRNLIPKSLKNKEDKMYEKEVFVIFNKLSNAASITL
ncbi:5215_t:CDS:2, partial [Dentiscutata erythropus]